MAALSFDFDIGCSFGFAFATLFLTDSLHQSEGYDRPT